MEEQDSALNKLYDNTGPIARLLYPKVLTNYMFFFMEPECIMVCFELLILDPSPLHAPSVPIYLLHRLRHLYADFSQHFDPR